MKYLLGFLMIAAIFALSQPEKIGRTTATIVRSYNDTLNPQMTPAETLALIKSLRVKPLEYSAKPIFAND